MYNIMKDSLFEPKNILLYRKKSGWFVLLYLLLLAFLMSIGSIVYYVNYDQNEVITSVSTGCDFQSNRVVCPGVDYDETKGFNLYGIEMYFLEGTESISSVGILEDTSIIFHGNQVRFMVSSEERVVLSLTQLNPTNLSFNDFFINLQTSLFWFSLVMSFLMNLVLLLIISLFSTIPFLRLRKFIRYKIIYKLVIFAITPIAFLMTFYNLIPFGDIVFFVLMLVGYRSLYVLQKELMRQTYLHLAKTNPQDVTSQDSYQVVEDENQEEEDNPEESNQEDDER